jgi:hypothetical protein
MKISRIITLWDKTVVHITSQPQTTKKVVIPTAPRPKHMICIVPTMKVQTRYIFVQGYRLGPITLVRESLLCTRIRAGHLGSCAGQPGSATRLSRFGEWFGRWRWVQLLLPAHSWERPFLTAFSPGTPPFSRACYPVNLVRSCGSRKKCVYILSASEWSLGRWAISQNYGVMACVVIVGTQTENPDERARWAEREREKIHTVRPAGLKSRRSFSYTTITKISCFWLCCCSLHNAKCIIGD